MAGNVCASLKYAGGDGIRLHYHAADRLGGEGL